MSNYELILLQEHVDDIILANIDTQELKKTEAKGYWIEAEREYAGKGYSPSGFSVLRAVASAELNRMKLRLEAGLEELDV